MTIAAQIHALGAGLIFVGALVLLPLAKKAGPESFWACASFLVTGFLVFLVSSTYHFLSDGYLLTERFENVLENLDHCSIYLFIAGTYTPFLLSALAKPWRVPLLVFIWIVAVLGITYTLLKPRLPKILQSRFLYTGVFVLMGWILIVRIGEIYTKLTRLELIFLAAGGAAYSIGAVIYSTKRPKLFVGVFGFHELWHVMVLLGAAFHYLLILALYSGTEFGLN